MNMRSLISFGKNSYVVSLPKLWVDKNKLKKGDLISVDESREGLLLRTSNIDVKQEEPKSIVINAENKSLTHLRTEIVSAYLDNYNIIEVMSKELKKNATDIKAILHDLSGLEIINQSSMRIVAKDLINVNEVSILTLMRRMDNITRAMLDDTLGCFGGKEEAESIIHRDNDINRLHFLTSRVIRGALKDIRIANSLGTNPLKLHSDHIVTTKIERIADNAKRICRYIEHTKLDQRWGSELKDVFNAIRKSYVDVMKAYYTNDQNIALQIEETNKNRILDCERFFDKHNHQGLKYSNGNKAGVCNFRPACGATVKIIENMKEMASSVKYIARTIIGGG